MAVCQMKVTTAILSKSANPPPFLQQLFHDIFSKKNLTFQTVSPTVSPPKLTS